MPLQHASKLDADAMKRQITAKKWGRPGACHPGKIMGICLRTTLIAGFWRGSRRCGRVEGFPAEDAIDRVGIFTSQP